MRPADVNYETERYALLNLKSETLKTTPNLELGDDVRMNKKVVTFHRGYLPNWSDEFYTVDKVNTAPIPLYEVKDEEGNIFKRRLYSYELQKIKKEPERTYRIEKIVRKRTTPSGTEYLVKFLGFPQRAWIKEQDLIDLRNG